MPAVIPVKFKYAARDLWFDPAQTDAQEGDHVICTTERGQEIGLVTAGAREVSDERLHEAIGESTLRPLDRIATEGDLNHAARLADKGDEALPTFRRLVHEAGLDMKPVGVEYLFGGNKAVCYFSAEERVDFRQLVRDLSRELHERIDMRQIGVREEAAIVGGYAHCGQELCCARFGHQFEPVSIRMAKEQDLPLNSSKISGACGRLMCCLRYEFEAYRDFKGRAPKRNAVIETPLGKAKIVEYDTPKEQICLRLENGKQVRVPLVDMEASEAARKKSEELGCACRPDTVTRSALERLQSPDVQMALAELDRQMGIETGVTTYSESDIFVETKPRRRRGRKQGGSGTQASDGPSDKGDVVERGASKRTRRRRKKGEPPTDAAGQGAPNADEPASRRRRRHHGVTGGASAAQPDSTSQHHARRTAEPQGSAGPKPGARPVRRRRRPGDHGGQGPGDASAQRSDGRPQGQGGSRGEAGLQGEGGGRSRRRRSRGRGGSGTSGAGGSGSGTSGAGGSEPASE